METEPEIYLRAPPKRSFSKQIEVAQISRWATESFCPTLTILIDIPAEVGLNRLQSIDRLESQPLDFHERVRQEFLQIAMMDPERYFVINGMQSVDEIHNQIIARVKEIL